MSENKLPEIRDLRKGSMIYIIENSVVKRVYDDYSPREKISTVRRWRVKVYDKSRKCELSQYILVRKGLYPTLKRAIYEVERFSDRGKNLIFYLLPIGLEIDNEKLFRHLWGDNPEQSGMATDEEVREEARKRLYYMTHRLRKGDIDVYKNYKFGCDVLEAFDKAVKEYKWKMFPYEVTGNGLAVLYVSYDRENWQPERQCMGWSDEYSDGIVPACVFDWKSKVVYFGDIEYKCEHGTIFRVY